MATEEPLPGNETTEEPLPGGQKTEEQTTETEELPGDEKKQTHSSARKKIRNEIVETETTYCEALQFLIGIYVKTLEKEKKNASKYDMEVKTFDQMIMNLPTLAPTNLQFLEELKQTDPLEVASVLNKYADIFKLYVDYTNRFDVCQSNILHLKKSNKKFRPILENIDEQLRTVGPKLGTMSYLIMPVQRIPRYELLLKSLIEASSENHPQFQNMTDAHQKLKKICTFINNSKIKRENLTKLMEICDRIKGIPTNLKLVVPHRKLKKDGKLTVWMTHGVNQKSSMKICERHVFLFNDMLLLCKADGIVFKGALTLSSATVEKKDTDFSVETAKSAFGFREEDETKRNEWITLIEECITTGKKMRDSKRKIKNQAHRSLNSRDKSVHNLILTGLSSLGTQPGSPLNKDTKKGKEKSKKVLAQTE